MKKKCDNCDKPATIHLTEIVGGEKTERHLCGDCAAEAGITIKANVPISKLLEEFVLQAAPDAESLPDPVCDVCGLHFGEFRDGGLLGCPNDYEAFIPAMTDMIARVQCGETQHVGKVPHRADEAEQKQALLLRLRAELKQAVQNEHYEQAAILRDQIKQAESQ